MRPRLSLKARGLQWLAQREHSRSELRRKLLAHLQKEWRAALRAASAADDRPARSRIPASGRGRAFEIHTAASGRDAASGPDLANDAPDTARREHPDPSAFDAQVEEALDWLQAHHHLSDERFVESRLHVRAPRFGNRRIQQELAQHGVTLSIEERQALKASEHDRALAVWRRKFAALSGDAAAQAKQARFLAARGFSPEVIRRVLKAQPDD